MSHTEAAALLDTVIEAHGGMEYWNSLEALDVELSASGFLFTAKQRPVLDHVRVRAYTKEPRFAFFDFPKKGQTAELLGTSEVRILDSAGAVVARREEPRAAFKGIRRLFSWDDLDFTYFGGYATWNYLTAPFLLARKGVELELLEPVQNASGQLTRLRATFPADIPTHSREQIFYFDGQRLLRRLDYTAEVVGGWAHAAHLCDEYRDFGRLKVPTRRKALPTVLGSSPLSMPVLVAIAIHAVTPVPSAA